MNKEALTVRLAELVKNQSADQATLQTLQANIYVRAGRIAQIQEILKDDADTDES